MSDAQEASEEFLEVNASLREGDLIYFETPAAQDRNAYLQANQVTYVVGFQADGQNFSEPPNFKVGQATSHPFPIPSSQRMIILTSPRVMCSRSASGVFSRASSTRPQSSSIP